MTKKIWNTLLLGTICLVIDVVTKLLATPSNSFFYNKIIIPNFFNLTYVQNNGAAFSLFVGQITLLVIVTFVILIFLIKVLFPTIKTKLQVISYGLLLGGIVGNFIERIFKGYVTDFLNFYIFGYDFPVFNLADVFICSGVGLIIFDTLKGWYHDNRSKRKAKSKN